MGRSRSRDPRFGTRRSPSFLFRRSNTCEKIVLAGAALAHGADSGLAVSAFEVRIGARFSRRAAQRTTRGSIRVAVCDGGTRVGFDRSSRVGGNRGACVGMHPIVRAAERRDAWNAAQNADEAGSWKSSDPTASHEGTLPRFPVLLELTPPNMPAGLPSLSTTPAATMGSPCAPHPRRERRAPKAAKPRPSRGIATISLPHSPSSFGRLVDARTPRRFRLGSGKCVVGGDPTRILSFRMPPSLGCTSSSPSPRRGNRPGPRKPERHVLSRSTRRAHGARARRPPPHRRSDRDRDRPGPRDARRPRTYDGDSYRGMVGRSAAMRRIFGVLARLEGSLATVLVTGESGRRQRAVARAPSTKEAQSRRSPLVIVNCGTLAGDLVASELFGHRRGAFTGAVDARRGACPGRRGNPLARRDWRAPPRRPADVASRDRER